MATGDGMMGASGDAADVLRFLRALHEGGEGYAEFRSIHPTDKKQNEQVFRRLPVKTLPPLPVETHNVYFGAAPRTRAAGTADAVEVATALWQDTDAKAFAGGKDEAMQKLMSLGALAPSIINDSGHGLHPYWLLREPLDAAEATRLMDALREAINPRMDKVSDPSRVMRLPGTWNLKDAEPLPVRVVHWHPERRFNPGDFDLILGRDPAEDRADRDDRDDESHALLPAVVRCSSPGVRVSTPLPPDIEKSQCPEKAPSPPDPHEGLPQRQDNGFRVLRDHRWSLSSLSPALRLAVEDAIRRTLPEAPGWREKLVFSFARALLAIPELAGRTVAELVPVIREWHRQALSSIGTKPFDVTLASFARAWKRAIVPLGVNFMHDVLESARRVPVPECVAGLGDKIELLACICVELQRRARREPFWLGCRDAAKLLGLASHDDANKLIRFLREDLGFLTLVEPGTARKAARYRLAESVPQQTEKE